MWRWICLIAGYASLCVALYLSTNVPSPGGGSYQGWEGFFFPVLGILGVAYEFFFQAWVEPGWSPADAVYILYGVMNLWLLGTWACLFSKSPALLLSSAMWGYAGFVTMAIREAGSDIMISGSDFLLCLSFLLVATGILLSVRRRN